MIEAVAPFGEGFTPAVISEGWRICYIHAAEQYGKLEVFKRHNDTDEAFVLLAGEATLFTMIEDKIQEISLESQHIYNVKRGTWHHLQVSPDACLIAMENSDVSPKNTERMNVIC